MTTGSERLADWALAPVSSRFREAADATLPRILLDSFASALAARNDATAQSALSYVHDLGSAGDCMILGTRMRAAAPFASFANGVLVRTLEYNDVYTGPGMIGHPSDNMPVALAAAEIAGSSGRDLIDALALGYEIYGRVLDRADPKGAWDHVSASAIAAAIMGGRLLGLTRDKLANGISLAASFGLALQQVRRGHISSAKSMANAMVAQNAMASILMAAHGFTGPLEVLEAPQAYLAAFGRATIDDLLEPLTGARLSRIGLKPYPCFVLGQGPIAAAAALKSRIDDPSRIRSISIISSEHPVLRSRTAESGSRQPQSREDADHSLPYLVVITLLEGTVSVAQFESSRWLDDDVRALLARTEVVIDASMTNTTSQTLSCRIVITLDGGAVLSNEVLVPPGDPASPLSFDAVAEKFARSCEGLLDQGARDTAASMVSRCQTLLDLRPLLAALTPGQPAGA